jgi:ATP-dependent helicase HrpB
VWGGSARLLETSVVREAPLLVALDAELRGVAGRPRGEVRVRLASAVTEELLLDLFPGALRYEDTLSFDAQSERVDATERLLYDDLVLSEARKTSPDPRLVSERLFEEAIARGPRAFAPEGALDAVVARLAFAASQAPQAKVPVPFEPELAEALRALCQGRRSFAELREADLPSTLVSTLAPEARAALERLAPERVRLPGGRSLLVGYQAGRPPFVESRLQDFFGMAQGPSVGAGRVPLVLHLLAPNGRAVQVTTDLAGFWSRHYPGIRRELARRYPRHAWPEDPLHASPPAARTRR